MWIAIGAAIGAASCRIANSVTRAALAERAGPKKSAAVMAVWAIAWAAASHSRPWLTARSAHASARSGRGWRSLHRPSSR